MLTLDYSCVPCLTSLCLNMATSATADQAQAIIDDKSLVEEVIYYFYWILILYLKDMNEKLWNINSTLRIFFYGVNKDLTVLCLFALHTAGSEIIPTMSTSGHK